MKEFLKKNFLIIVTIVMLIVMVGNCAQNREITELKNTLQSIKDSTYTRVEIDNKFEAQRIDNEIIGYEISYRMLYDNNAVVRTKERPDDIMNNYVEKIKELEKEKNEILDK